MAKYKRINQIVIAVLVGAPAAIWIQSQLFLWNFGPLDGRGTDWGVWTIHMWVEGVVWIVIILGTVYISVRQNESLTKLIVPLILSLGLISVVSSYITREDQATKPTHEYNRDFDALFGFHPKNNTIILLLDTFQSANNSIDSLEDSIKALLLFDQLSLEVQESFLIKSLESIERMTSQIESLHEAWRLGSEKLVTQFVHEPLKMIPSFYQKLILDRNVAWLQKITKLINDNNSTLIAVGAGHFLGESNIIDALINAGHNIERLT